jgi:predicted TIM-barrel fold metal-dependent hydrolase
MNTYGRGKVLFGTNWPQLAFDRAVKQAQELPLSDEARMDFLARAACRVFKL